jgi:hypothetical protein
VLTAALKDFMTVTQQALAEADEPASPRALDAAAAAADAPPRMNGPFLPGAQQQLPPGVGPPGGGGARSVRCYGAASVASCLAAGLTEIYLCNVCYYQKSVETQRTRVGRAWLTPPLPGKLASSGEDGPRPSSPRTALAG